MNYPNPYGSVYGTPIVPGYGGVMPVGAMAMPVSPYSHGVGMTPHHVGMTGMTPYGGYGGMMPGYGGVGLGMHGYGHGYGHGHGYGYGMGAGMMGAGLGGGYLANRLALQHGGALGLGGVGMGLGMMGMGLGGVGMGLRHTPALGGGMAAQVYGMAAKERQLSWALAKETERAQSRLINAERTNLVHETENLRKLRQTGARPTPLMNYGAPRAMDPYTDYHPSVMGSGASSQGFNNQPGSYGSPNPDFMRTRQVNLQYQESPSSRGTYSGPASY